MNLNQLKLFYLAVKRKSLSSAARELNITQPAVTKGIQRIQEHYNVKLVHRTGKDIVLTSAGEAVYQHADKIFEMEKMAEECLLKYRQKKMNQVCLHASESFGAYYLPVIISFFSKAYPHVKVTVDIVPNKQVIDETLNLRNDFGSISVPITHKKLVIQEILEDQPVIIVPPEHPFVSKASVAPHDLEGQVMIMHEEGSVFQEFIHKFKQKYKITFSMPITLSNNEAIKRAVEGGTGIALISKHAVHEEIKNNQLVALPLTDNPIDRKFYMISHKDKFLSGPVQALMEMIRYWDSQNKADRT
ncbi:MAG: LysR family transcriptional regulator [Desulfobacterales bacterium]|nr:LysR family transcriptional regulator [Desulfobacterales bacterium]